METSNTPVPQKPFYLLSPDGFLLTSDAQPYTCVEQARKDFEEWKQRFQHQGYYSSPRYGRIPLHDLQDYMIRSEHPFSF